MLIINNKREVVVNLITIMQIDNKQSNTISYMQQQTPTTTQLLNACQYLAARCGCSFFSPLGADKHLNNTITHKVYA